MNAPGTTPAIIASALIVVFGIIELGSSIGIVARYNKYQDVFRPSVGLSAFDIVVGLYAIAIGILCLFGIIRQRPALSKTGIICVAVLGVASIASLIAALVINSQAVGYVRGRLSYRMNSYIETDSSITIMDMIQNNYQCCGENLWLDWQRVGLGLSTTNSTITGTVIDKCTSNAGLKIFVISNRSWPPSSSDFRFSIKSFNESCSSTTTSSSKYRHIRFTLNLYFQFTLILL